MAYEVREYDDDEDAAVLSCSLFQSRDLYAGQVLKFQALTRKLEFQRAQVSECAQCNPDGLVNKNPCIMAGNPLKIQEFKMESATEMSLLCRIAELKHQVELDRWPIVRKSRLPEQIEGQIQRGKGRCFTSASDPHSFLGFSP